MLFDKQLALSSLILILLPRSGVTQIYPSTEVAWVIPGYWQAPTIPMAQKTAADVFNWEVNHADAIFGTYKDVEINKSITAIGYMYAQKFDCRPKDKEAFLMKELEHSSKFQMEDAYLHFREDTKLHAKKFSRGLDYLTHGQIYHLILSRNGNYQTARLPLKIKPKDELFILSSYPFDHINVHSQSQPMFYAPVANKKNEIAQWTLVTPTWEKTQAKFNERIGRSPMKPITQGRGLNTGIPALANGLRIWPLKLTWEKNDELTQISLKPYIKITKNTATILGWHPENDKNKDGYINNIEFKNRKYPEASARFIEQARIVPIGHHWPGGCWYRTNLTQSDFYPSYAKWYHQSWEKLGLSGAYNDDMAKLLGDNQFTVISGGRVLEKNKIVVGKKQAAIAYGKDMARFFLYLKKRYPQYQLAANISEYNPWKISEWPPELINNLNIWLREHYLRPSIGLTRLQKSWDNFALAKQGDKSLLMHTTKHGRSFYQPTSKKAWETDIETGLALYYLFNIPNHTWFNSWNQTWRYGSDNTTTQIWYQDGVPKNLAYHPESILKHDIGIPTKPPQNTQFVKWIDSPYKKATTTTKLGEKPLYPANWFWLYKSHAKRDTPSDGVIARQYTKGLVLYRAYYEINYQPYFATPEKSFKLDGQYQRIHFDGSLSQPSDKVTLKGYHGVILKKVMP